MKFVSLALETMGTGYFLKVGKRLESGHLVYWVMVPLEKELVDNENNNAK